MGLADRAKKLGITPYQYFKIAYDKNKHIYPDAMLPEKAYEWYKLMGFIPNYVINFSRSQQLAESFQRIREKYKESS